MAAPNLVPMPPAGATWPPPRRRSWTSFTVGILVALVGALVFAAIASSGRHTTSVLEVARAVPQGHTVGTGDLAAVDVQLPGGVAAIPASEESTVVGQPAAQDLAAGELVTRAQLGSPLRLGAGDAAVGLALKPGQYPSTMHGGDRVEVLIGPSSGTGAPAPPTGGTPIVATVASITPPSGSSVEATTAVVLEMSREDAGVVAVASSVSLVVLPRG